MNHRQDLIDFQQLSLKHNLDEFSLIIMGYHVHVAALGSVLFLPHYNSFVSENEPMRYLALFFTFAQLFVTHNYNFLKK